LISGTRYEIWSISKITRPSSTKCQTKVTTVNLLPYEPRRMKYLPGGPSRGVGQPHFAASRIKSSAGICLHMAARMNLRQRGRFTPMTQSVSHMWQLAGPSAALLSYPVFIPKPCTHCLHDPGSIVPHIRPKVFTDNQMSQIKYKYYYINSALKTVTTLNKMEQQKTP
jgi:hypothetical protein